MKFKINNELSHRRVDDNGYLYIEKSPILRSGILEYYGEELTEGKVDEIDGVKIDPKKLYKVYISPEELEKSLESFKLIPVVNEHEWLGNEGADAKDYQIGSTGENLFIEGDMLMSPLSFTSQEVASDIQKGKEELSAAYTQSLKRSDDPRYDFIASDFKANHVALVDRGRCGSDVRILNSVPNTLEKKTMKVKVLNKDGKQFLMGMKARNEIKLIVDGKELDIDKFLTEEEVETDANGNPVHKDSIKEAENTAEPMKGEKEDLLEKDKSLESVNKCKNEEEEEEDKKKEKKVEEMVNKATNAFKDSYKKEQEELKKAYNAASSVIGEFNPFGMTPSEIYTKALNHKGIDVDKEELPELKAMLRACNSISKVDEGFSYGSSSLEEIEINV